MARPTLYLMLGYPGAGKTTAARIIASLTGAVRLSSDQFRAEQYENPQFTREEHAAVYTRLDHMTREYLEQGKSVIYDANLNRLVHRQEKYDIAKLVHARTVLVWVQTPTELARHRATVLGERDPHRPFGNMETSVFERLIDEIEPPTKHEDPFILNGTKLTAEYIAKQLHLS